MHLNTAWTNEMAQALKRLNTLSTGTTQFREPRALGCSVLSTLDSMSNLYLGKNEQLDGTAITTMK